MSKPIDKQNINHKVPNSQPQVPDSEPSALSSPPSAQTDVLVKVENLGKKFCRDLKTSLWYGVKDLSSELFGRQRSEELRPKEFWAVNDISFELRRGECLGLIGHNGAGKSTLLKMLNGLIKPDKGTITMKGRIGALIELGAGFNPVLTGRENIYINGQVLGFTKKEIDEKFDAIVEFAEIGDFIDSPVRNYSSGMKVRLGFAVASQMEPDILLIDEVLAVGDLGFQIKCLNSTSGLLKNAALILVSHSMPSISRICNTVLNLENGRSIGFFNNVAKGIDLYYQRYKINDLREIGGESIKLKDAKLVVNRKEYKHGEDIVIQGEVDFKISISFINRLRTHIYFRLILVSQDFRAVLDCNSLESSFLFTENDSEIDVSIRNIYLRGGKYSFSLVCIDRETDYTYYRVDYLLPIRIISNFPSWADTRKIGEWDLK